MSYSIIPCKRKDSNGKTDKDKVVPLVVFLRNKSKQIQITTKIKARRKDFVKGKDGAYHIKNSCNNSLLINKEIQRIKFELDKIETFDNILSIGDYKNKAKAIIENEPEDMIGKDVITIADAATLYYKKFQKKSTQKSVKYKLDQFCKFAKNNDIIDLRELNRPTFNQYKAYLVNRNFRNTTTIRLLQTIKSFVRWCRNELNTKIEANVLRAKISLLTGDGLTINLEEDEIRLLEKAKLTGKLDKVKDLALFQMYTGQRFSDIVKFDKKQVVDNRWIFVQQKTNKHIELQLHDKLLNILQKYDFKLPVISSQRFNKYLKELFELLQIDREVMDTYYIGEQIFYNKYKVYEKISCHDMRHTFICESIRRNVPMNDIMYWSGHRDVKSFQVYVASTGNASSKNIRTAWA